MYFWSNPKKVVGFKKPFFGIMVDESIYINVTGYFVLFVIIVKEDLSITIFLRFVAVG